VSPSRLGPAAGGLIVVAAGVWLVFLRPAAGPPQVPAAATGVARVVRTDLVTTQPVAGTVGFGATATLSAATTTTPQALNQAQGAAATAGGRVAADQTAAADGHAVDELALGADLRRERADCAVSSASDQCAGDHERVAQDRAAERQRDDAAAAALAADRAALSLAQQALAQAEAIAASPGGFFTALPSPGAVVAQGQPLYQVDGRPVPLLYGALPAYRVLRPGVEGADVRQLEQDLIALGYANGTELTADGSFTQADAAAVRRWQAAAGMPATGVVNLGDAVFLSGAIRVTALHAAAGGAVQGGQPILDYTATSRLVTVQLAPAMLSQVQTGDAVTVDLPDGRTSLPGRVASVGTVATAGAQGPVAPTQNGAPQASIPVTVTFDDPSRVTALDQAPVIVDITTRSARGVLAVPVDALLALAGGGYGVEVVGPDGARQLVAVQTGIYDQSRVEVSGPGLREGVSVVVPAS
jgi:peptidoglycan hydrolase-like protein with peptidoglycan-binding domain